MTANKPQSYSKRLIEVDLPIARISAHARREKSIRHGHISTLHIWWARRPLAACRAVICASLWPDPVDPLCPQEFRDKAAELISAFANKVIKGKIGKRNLTKTASPESLARWEAIAKSGIPLDPNDVAHQNVLRFALLDFIADFANWDNSTVPDYLETSRSLTQAAHEALGGEPGTRPLVVDPFAGGGSIPLESLRVGADAFASDLNPVAVLLNKVVLEYIPKYGQRLADEVRKWGQWVKEQAEQELSDFYPKDPDGATPIAYIWARTIMCDGPGCGCQVPVTRSLWLDQTPRAKAALNLCVSDDGTRIETTVETNLAARAVGPATSQRGSVTCPKCGYTTARTSVEKQANERGLGNQLLAVAIETRGGRRYRAPNDGDLEWVRAAAEKLEKTRHDTEVPTEELPYLRSIFNVRIYGIDEWGKLFSPRQQLFLTTLHRYIAACDLEETGLDQGGRRALKTLLAFIADKATMVSCNIARWRGDKGRLEGAFAMQAMPMVWDWGELNPFNDSMMPFSRFVDAVAEVVESVSQFADGTGNVSSNSATDVPLPDDAANFVFTDPPYYDAIPYANLSDFFYVWLRRALCEEYPDLFSAAESPKRTEIVQLAERNPKYAHKTKEFFEREMQRAMSDMRRIGNPAGLGCVVFAHKTTSGWEALLSAIVDAGWVVTASWPIDTEMTTRFKAIGTASLASSVHLVCRPRENPDGSLREEVGEWRDVLAELPKRIHEWMPRLADEGVVGADAIFACLGPALEIFSRYSRVEKASGEEATLREYLEHVWAAVSTEALSMIFQDADAAGLEPDARLTAMWLWTLGGMAANGNGNGEESEKVVASTGYTLEFDAARKIAQGLGIHLEKSESFVEVKGDKARLLPVAERAKRLFGKGNEVTPGKSRRKKKSEQMSLFAELDEAEAADDGWGDVKGPAPGETALDRVHQAMILFAAGRSEAMKRFLVEDGAGTDARFWKLAQSLSALYPAGTDEKRWVDGVLARKKGLGL